MGNRFRLVSSDISPSGQELIKVRISAVAIWGFSTPGSQYFPVNILALELTGDISFSCG
jgi:hypothetical protein